MSLTGTDAHLNIIWLHSTLYDGEKRLEIVATHCCNYDDNEAKGMTNENRRMMTKKAEL